MNLSIETVSIDYFIDTDILIDYLIDTDISIEYFIDTDISIDYLIDMDSLFGKKLCDRSILKTPLRNFI